MLIEYKNGRLRRLCDSQVEQVRTLGTDGARKLHRRLNILRAAPDLARAFQGATGNLHQLAGDLGIDRRSVTRVRVTYVGDYHA
jgi:plasmid maintenance system killer protein